MKQSILLTILAILFILLSPAIASADIIYLNDGAKIMGDIIEGTSEKIIIKNNEEITIIDITNIIKIVFEYKKEQNAEYSQLRDTIKKYLEKLDIENKSIIIEINIIEEKIIDVSYDNYDMDIDTYRIDGTNLKDYYNLDEEPKYFDIIGYYKNKEKGFLNIIGDIVDVDKNKIRIKTFSGIVIKDIAVIYTITFKKTNKEIEREILTHIIDYYNSKYWKFEEENSFDKEIVYTNQKLYKKYNPMIDYINFCFNFSNNYFHRGSYNIDDDISPAASIEVLKTTQVDKNDITFFTSIGGYLGIYFNVPHKTGYFWNTVYFKTSDIVILFEGNIGIIFWNRFSLLLDIAIGFNIPLDGSQGFCVFSFGGGINLMFTKVFGIRFLANFKMGGDAYGFGFDVGLIFRFGN